MFKFALSVSQKRPVACSSNVNAANESVVEMRFDGTRPDLEKVFRDHYERIARVIAGVIRDPARAEELAVDVFLKWEQAGSAHGEGAAGWLYRAAVRVALNELRRKALLFRYERLLASVFHGNRAEPTPHELYVADEVRERVRVVLGAIEPRQAELLLLRSNDLSYQELASTLNLNPASVGTLLSRALEAFRKEFVRRYGKERYGQE
jgi:RNA polymerase sigma-70 factor (ECF subfamily)